jgi:hypothetical protein
LLTFYSYDAIARNIPCYIEPENKKCPGGPSKDAVRPSTAPRGTRFTWSGPEPGAANPFPPHAAGGAEDSPLSRKPNTSRKNAAAAIQLKGLEPLPLSWAGNFTPLLSTASI